MSQCDRFTRYFCSDAVFNLQFEYIIFSEHEIGILEKVLTLPCSKENQ